MKTLRPSVEAIITVLAAALTALIYLITIGGKISYSGVIGALIAGFIVVFVFSFYRHN